MVNTSTDKAKLTSSVARGKHVWEKNACINCRTLLGEGAYFAPEVGNVWDRWGGKEDPATAREILKAWMRHVRRGDGNAAFTDRPGTQRSPISWLDDSIKTQNWPPNKAG
jgi:nitric oxide reductase subunit C